MSPSPSPSAATSSLILVIEDDDAQRATLVDALTARGHRVDTATTGQLALERARFSRPDVILLDLGLPDIDGIQLCRHLLLQVDCPVIVVTADSDEDRIVEALDIGAADYVLKPFNMRELLARVRVALRHKLATTSIVADDVLECGDVEIDVAARQALVGDTVIDLFPRQFDLLTTLVRNEGRVLTYDTLTRVVWGMDTPDDHRFALRTAISKLRKSLGVGPLRPTIETEHHIGYRLVANPTPAD